MDFNKIFLLAFVGVVNAFVVASAIFDATNVRHRAIVCNGINNGSPDADYDEDEDGCNTINDEADNI